MNAIPRRGACAHGLVVTASILTFAVAGCGVSAESQPTQLDSTDVPFGLLEDDPGGSPTMSGETSFALYFVDPDGVLVRVERTRSGRRGPNHALNRLVAGPTPAEADIGVATAIPPGSSARASVISGDLMVVELTGSLVEACCADAAAAVAQIVFTVTESEGVAQVLFRIDGEAVEVPRGDGALTDEPVTRADYSSLGA